jgi:hypothetical protein
VPTISLDGQDPAKSTPLIPEAVRASFAVSVTPSRALRLVGVELDQFGHLIARSIMILWRSSYETLGFYAS